MRILLTILTLLFAAILSAQQLNVTSIQMVTDDTQPTVYKSDKKGRVYACVMVKTPQIQGIRFNSNGGEEEIADSDGNYQLWIKKDTRTISFEHPNYLNGRINFKDFGIEVEGGVCYEVLLSPAGDVYLKVPQRGRHSMYVTLNVHPEDAKLLIDGELIPLADGKCTKFLPKGYHSFKASAPLYYSDEISREMKWNQDGDSLSIILKPNYGWISFEANDVLEGADFSVNDSLRGKYPFRTDRLQSGIYYVSTRQQFYKDHFDEVVVKDGLTTTYAPKLAPDFSDVTLHAVNEARILIAGEYLGSTNVCRRLQSDIYTVEVQKPRHRPVTMSIDVPGDGDTIAFTLPKPIPIYGNLDVRTEPDSCLITIRDLTGDSLICQNEVPQTFRALLIGDFEVTATCPGFLDDIQAITIKDGQTDSLYIVLRSPFDDQIDRASRFYQQLTEFLQLPSPSSDSTQIKVRPAHIPSCPTDMNWVMGTWQYDSPDSIQFFFRFTPSLMTFMIIHNDEEHIIDSQTYDIVVEDGIPQLRLQSSYLDLDQDQHCIYFRRDDHSFELKSKVLPYDGPTSAHPTVTFKSKD